MGRGQGDSSPARVLGLIVRICVLAGLYVLAAKLGLGLASENRNVTAVWPPTGIAAAALLLWGGRVWPGIAAGAFLANLANGAGGPLAAAITVGNTAAPVLAFWVLRRLRFREALDRVRDVIALFIVGIAAMTVSASAGVAALWMNDAIGSASAASVWLVWWIGDAFGVVLFAPVALLLPRLQRGDPLISRPFEAVALMIVSAATTWATFATTRPIAFVIAIPVVWAALRFERAGTAVVVVIVSIIAIVQTVAGQGQFSHLSPTENLISLQVFNAILGSASIVLAAVMHERTLAVRALRVSEDRYRQVFDHASDLICIHDDTGRLTYANHAAEEITGYSMQRLLTMSITDLVAPSSAPTVRRTIDRQVAGDLDTTTYEIELVGASGRRVTLELSASPISRPDAPFVVQLIGRDVTSRRLAEEQLRSRSLTDPLTALPNRTLLRERLDYALAIARRDGTQVALALIDIDDFKAVNTRRGHDHGDLVLAAISKRLDRSFRAPDTVARLGGDEFAVLAPSLAPGRTAEVIIEHLNSELETPFDVAGEEHAITVSVGIAVFPTHAEDADALIKNADLAMHDAKRSGGARHSVYNSALDSQSMRRYTLEDELRAALGQGDLVMHYQPKIEMATMRTVGVEGLLRWPHPRLGDVPPDEFIPVAAAAGSLPEITGWVLNEAIGRCATWNNGGFDLTVAVNLTASDLHPALASRIHAHLDAHDLPPDRLTVEVRECDVRDESARSVMERISGMGVRLSIDDFGAGAASMAQLSRLPLTELKIDRSFVASIASDAKARAVARSIIELAHNLGLQAVAEGVETREAWTVLEELGADQVQGFLVCRPIPANDLESWLRTPAWSGRVR